MSEDFEAPKDDLDKELPAGSEEHSDYKPADAKDANIKHQLSGMYQNWFLDYASYVILERAVPHIMDGLKPVQRRILHSMRRMEDGRYNKVANIVGHTMQFHPHGDASIGDALVQLGQKDLLVDCQGNWGNILTGDSAAAPRYIEARLSKFALDVVFNPKTTEWKLSYDGTNVYWDFVELPSQFMENFAIEKEFLHTFARHYQTGELIPDELVQRIVDSSNFNAAYACLRQVSFGLLDMAWYTRNTPFEGDVKAYEKKAWEKAQILPSVAETCMSTQFSHIFAGGYSAGYYSYKWAEVLDADAFSLFKQTGIFNPETAASFRENILSKGGTEHPMTLYKRFRGQEPTIDALLIRNGIKKLEFNL